MSTLDLRGSQPPDPQDSGSVALAGAAAIADIHLHGYRVYSFVTGEITAEMEAITNEQHFRLNAPMAHAVSEQCMGQVLMACEDASDRIRRCIREW